MQRLNARLPPEQDVFDAVNTFLQHKKSSHTSIPDIQAKHLLRSILYIKPRLIHSLDLPTLRLWLQAFAHVGHRNSSTHQEIVVFLLRDVRENMSHPVAAFDPDELKLYLNALCYTGATVTARDMFIEQCHKHGLPRLDRVSDVIFTAFAKQGNEFEMLRTMELLEGAVAQAAAGLIALKPLDASPLHFFLSPERHVVEGGLLVIFFVSVMQSMLCVLWCLLGSTN